MGEQRHDLCSNFGEEKLVATSSEDGWVPIFFGDVIADSEFKSWTCTTKDAIFYSNEAQEDENENNICKIQNPETGEKKNTEQRGQKRPNQPVPVKHRASGKCVYIGI